VSFNITGGALSSPLPIKLTGNTVTDVFTAVQATRVLSITCCENTGSATPNLTVEKYDGTNSYYIRKAVAMTAGTAFIYNEPFELPAGWKIRVTSSDASGKIDAHVSIINPSALSVR
jgi:hypothetical protein